MKTTLRVSLAILLCICLCLAWRPVAYAGSTDYINLSVGDTRTLWASSNRGTVYSYGWYSNDISAVQVTGSVTSSSCTIKVVGSTSKQVVVRCDMYYIDSYGMVGSDYYDCVISINGSGSGGNGSYTISAPSNVTVDLASTNPITITSGVNFSDTIYLEFSNKQGNAGWNFEYPGGNTAYLYIFPETLHNGTCEIELIEHRGSTFYIKDRISIRYTTFCSHRYNAGTVTIQPTYSSEGEKVRTCRYCGVTKTETIPKLTPPSEYVVSYNANGGENAPAKQTKTHGTALTLRSDVPTRSDSTSGNYTVTLNANGGTVSTNTLNAVRTTRYTFRNWNTASSGSGTSYAPGASYTADSDATLYAQWNTSTSTAAVVLPTPTKSGYVFKGWATSSSAATGMTGIYTPSGNVTLYAVWEADGVFGTWGNLTWTLNNNGDLTISGSGEISDFDAESTLAWRQYADSIKTVNIAQGVSRIGRSAFRNCTALTSVKIPNSVTVIGRSAFYDCTNLMDVTIPYGVSSVESWVFRGCEKLESMVFPSSVISIGDQVFCCCTALKSVTIPSSVTSMGEYVFNYCTGLTSVTIPDSVTSLGTGMFFGCSSLESVKIPNGMTEIGESFFYDCAALKSITIPGGVTSIGSWVFRGCESLTNITIPSGVTSIGDRAFCLCSGLRYITIPYGVTSVENLTFYGCSSLMRITIPSSVTHIGDYAFYSCDNLNDVYYGGMKEEWNALDIGDYNGSLNYATIHYPTVLKLPANLTEIEREAFAGGAFECVVIPATVTSIGSRAFANCPNLKRIVFKNGNIDVAEDFISGCWYVPVIEAPAGSTVANNMERYY